MTFALKIEVTAEDIAQGQRYHSDSCPIALAAKRAGVESPRVNQGGEMCDGGILKWESKIAGRWAIRFDQGREVRPRAFRFKALQ